MQPTLALLPLDDRPSSMIFPARIARIAGVDLRLPPRAILGHFQQPGSPTATAEWLKNISTDVSALLIAGEMLAYGGLFTSRFPDVSLERALNNVKVLEDIHKANPRLPMYAVTLITRNTISASSAKISPIYEALMRYSELHDLVEIQGKREYAAELQAVLSIIPQDVLHDHLETRRRNQAVNRRFLEYYSQGIVQELIILQDDSRPAGLHRPEQGELLDYARQLGMGGRLVICPGGDEGALDLLAHWLNRDDPLEFDLRLTSQEGANQIADYEDRSIRQTLEGHLHAANVYPGTTSGGPVLWIHTPSSIQEVDRAASEMNSLIRSGRMVALADVRFPNGSDPSLMERLCAMGLIPRLSAYAGWNTAGNTIGAAIAQASAWWAAVRQAAGDDQRQAQNHYLFERIVDDWGYQRVFRQPLEEALKGQGKDVLNLGEDAPPVEAEIRARLIRWAAQTWRSGLWKGDVPSLDISLPWSRTFEIEIEETIPAPGG